MAEIILENNQDKLPIDDGIKNTIEQVILKTLEEESCDFSAEISVNIVDAEEIKMINREQRNIDAVTDVLSFPMLEFDENGDIVNSDFDMDGENLLLGDIVICAERAKEQAEEFGHSFKREMAFLTVHSMLHLLGYDHMNKQEEGVMFARQDEILNLLGITREGDKSMSFYHALEGIFCAVKKEGHLRFHIMIAVLISIFAYFYGISRFEWAVLLLSICSVIGAELINTAIERAVDTATTEITPSAKFAKDVSAGAVLVFAVFSVLVGICLFGDLAKIASALKQIFTSPKILAPCLILGFALLIFTIWGGKNDKKV